MSIRPALLRSLFAPNMGSPSVFSALFGILAGFLGLTATTAVAADLGNRDNFGPVIVPPGTVFVLGDNRDDSRDSRVWGFLDKSLIRGKASFVYWSWAPDPEAPEWESPYVLQLLTIPFYNLAHFPTQVRWDRIGSGL